MKKHFYLFVFCIILSKAGYAQLLCINCYNQNDSISSNVNNLLLNGGFENTTCTPNIFSISFCPNSTFYACDLLNWTCTGGGGNTYTTVFTNSQYSMVPEGNLAAYFGNDFCKSCSNLPNDTSCINSTACSNITLPIGYPSNLSTYGGTSGVSLEQTVTGLTVGNTYVLEFWAGGEEGLTPYFTRDGLFAVDIGFGKTFLKDPPTKPVNGVGRTFVMQFNATAAAHTIKFTNWGHVCDSCTELVLDNVRLYTLAELDASVPHCFTGIKGIENNSVNLFPNPVTGKLSIKVAGNEVSEIVIYDITSREMLKEKFNGNLTLNIEQYPKGIYFYELKYLNRLTKKGKIVKD